MERSITVIIAVQSQSHVQLLSTHGLHLFRPLCFSPYPEFAQVHVHCIGDAVQPSHPLTPSSTSALNLSQPQGLFQ